MNLQPLMLGALVLAACAPTLAQNVTLDASKHFAHVVPPGMVLVKAIQGDLNKDQQPDVVLIVKGTAKHKLEQKDGHMLDRNRRGLIVLLSQQGRHEVALKNLSCFSSEHEDGGVYMAPELDVRIQQGNLLIDYGHGRYGSWHYNFRHQQGQFELIGYDRQENQGPITQRDVSINFLSKKMRIRVNTNPNAETENEVKLKETWQSFGLPRPMVLSDVVDFDGFDVEAQLKPMRSK